MERSFVSLCLFVAVFLAELGCVYMQQEQDTCRFLYQEEPSPTSETQCNIFQSTVTFVCRVSGDKQFDIQWHFTNDSEQAGNVNLNTIDFLSSIYSFHISPLMIVNNMYIWEYHMSILKVGQGSTGYYWCSVLPRLQTVLLNPSRVLYIEEQCSIQDLNSCPSDPAVSLHRSTDGVHCASAARNVSVVSAQDIDCSSSTTVLATAEMPTTAKTTKLTPPKATTTDSPPKKTDVDPDSLTTQKITTGSAGVVSSSDPKPATLTSTESMEPEFSTSTKAVLTNTLGTTQKMTSENESSSYPQDNQNDIPTDLVWLVIGVVLAILLTAVFILLVTIACLQRKKRRMRGQPVSSHKNRGETDVTLQERRPANEVNKTHSDITDINIQEPEYEEIPANILRVGSLRPSLSPQVPKLEDTDMNNSSHYEDLSIPAETNCCSPKNQYEAMIREEDPPDYSRLEHNGSFNISNCPSSSPIAPTLFYSPQGRQLHRGSYSGQAGPVFDDPQYDLANDFLPTSVKPHVKVGKSMSANANVENGYSSLDSDTSSKPVIFDSEEYHHQNSDSRAQLPPSARTVARRESHDTCNAHVYAPIKPHHPKQDGEYTIPIVTTREKYISEQGHLYHILETADADKEITNQSTEEDIPVIGIGQTASQSSINLKSPMAIIDQQSPSE